MSSIMTPAGWIAVISGLALVANIVAANRAERGYVRHRRTADLDRAERAVRLAIICLAVLGGALSVMIAEG